MTRIDFYISERPDAGEEIVCRLVEKAYGRGLRVLIHCPDPERCQRLDERLWTYRQGSFLPHERLSRDAEPEAPVLLGDEAEGPAVDVLINLDDAVPERFARHARVLEIVDGDPGRRAAGRARYAFYRDRGYPLQTHTL